MGGGGKKRVRGGGDGEKRGPEGDLVRVKF